MKDSYTYDFGEHTVEYTDTDNPSSVIKKQIMLRQKDGTFTLWAEIVNKTIGLNDIYGITSSNILINRCGCAAKNHSKEESAVRNILEYILTIGGWELINGNWLDSIE